VVRERAPGSRSSGKMLMGRIDSHATKSIDEAITAAGLWDRPSAPRYQIPKTACRSGMDQPQGAGSTPHPQQ